MINVAIIGAGIGGSHLASYLKLPEVFSVATICDLDLSRAAKLTVDHPQIALTDNYESVLAGPVDLVDICLPPHLHFDAAMAALAAGKHVICEKPLVASLAEADRLMAEAKRTGLVVSPVFQYRFGLGTAQIRALQDAGLAAKPFVASIETHWNRPAEYYDVAWRGTWATESGGAVLGHAIHIHDLLTSVLGPVASVHAEVDTRVNDIEVEDCAALSIRMESGALVTSSVTLGAADDTSRLRFVFEGFTAESDHAPYGPAYPGWTFQARRPTTQAQIDEVLATVSAPPIGYTGMFAAVADAIAGRTNNAVTIADGRRSLEFVTAVYSSARSGIREELPIGSNHPLYADWRP